jgi:hypothetical protein
MAQGPPPPPPDGLEPPPAPPASPRFPRARRNVDGHRHEDGRYAAFTAELSEFVPKARQFTDPVRTLAYGTDASFYRLNPKLVVKARVRAARRVLACCAARLGVCGRMLLHASVSGRMRAHAGRMRAPCAAVGLLAAGCAHLYVHGRLRARMLSRAPPAPAARGRPVPNPLSVPRAAP